MEFFSSLSIIHPRRDRQQELPRRGQAMWTLCSDRDKRFQAERVDRRTAGLTIRTCHVDASV